MKKTIAEITVFAVMMIGVALVHAAGNATDGKAVYEKSCKNCHGATGEANPAISKMMKVDIANRGSAEVQAMSDADIGKIITAGKGKMQPIRSVTGKSVDDVVAYVRTFKK
jgi:mono/diheme cytochrome c family protein